MKVEFEGRRQGYMGHTQGVNGALMLAEEYPNNVIKRLRVSELAYERHTALLVPNPSRVWGRTVRWTGEETVTWITRHGTLHSGLASVFD